MAFHDSNNTEWAHLVIRDWPMPTWSRPRMKPLFFLSLWMLCFESPRPWALKLQCGPRCGVICMTAAFSQNSKIQNLQHSERWIRNNLGSFEQGFSVHCSSASAACLYRWAEASWGGVCLSLHQTWNLPERQSNGYTTNGFAGNLVIMYFLVWHTVSFGTRLWHRNILLWVKDRSHKKNLIKLARRRGSNKRANRRTGNLAYEL